MRDEIRIAAIAASRVRYDFWHCPPVGECEMMGNKSASKEAVQPTPPDDTERSLLNIKPYTPEN